MEDENENISKIVMKIIEMVNNVGKKIQEFQLILKQLNNKDINKIDEKNILGEITKEEKSKLLNLEKEIEQQMMIVTKFIYNKKEVPDDIFNTISFLQIKFVDLINSYQNILEQNIAGDILKISYTLYLNKENSFIKSKIKYINNLIQLSFGIIENKGINFDLKNYIDDIFTFVEKILCNDIIFSVTEKINIMPGVISKIIKVVSFFDMILSSKTLNRTLNIMIMYIKIILEKFNNDNINFIKFFEFLEVYIYSLINKRVSKLGKIINNVVDLLVIFLESNKSIINEELYENIFFSINKNLIESITENEDNIEKILSKKPEVKNQFYLAFIKNKLYDKTKTLSKIKNNINTLKLSYKRKEYLRFNNNLIEFSGNLILYFQSEHNENKEIILELFNLFNEIIKLNKKFIFEMINTYELSIKDISIDLCKNKILSNLLSSIINSYNLEINIPLLYIILCFLYEKNNSIYQIFYQKSLEILMQKTKKFNSNLTKKKLKSKSELNNSIIDLSHSFNLMSFLIIQPYKKQYQLKLDIKKIQTLINFYYSIFCDNINSEQLEINKVSNSNISLVNFYCLNLCIFCYNNNIIFQKTEINTHIILSMINYSNKISLLKFSSILLVMLISKDNNIQNFLVHNFNFIINTILNKVIYFNSNPKDNISNMKIQIFNFFTSLLDLINQINNEEMSNFYCGEFTKYIRRLFPYIDINIKEKNFITIEIILEILYKISCFQNNIIFNVLYEQIYKKENQKKIMEGLDLNNNEKFVQFLKEKINLEKSNIFRQLILRICPIILSKKVTLISKFLSILKEYIPILYLLPMEREENENFSTEDPNNVSIPSSLGPVMFEIWKYLIFAMNNSNVTIVIFKNYLEIFEKIIKYRPQFFDSERIFIDLLPTVDIIFDNFISQYQITQFSNLIYDFIFEFMSRIIFINKYNVKYLENFQKFVNKFKKEIYEDKSEEKINEMNNNINLLYSCFEKN
jgi:hypothetical protein